MKNKKNINKEMQAAHSILSQEVKPLHDFISPQMRAHLGKTDPIFYHLKNAVSRGAAISQFMDFKNDFEMKNRNKKIKHFQVFQDNDGDFFGCYFTLPMLDYINTFMNKRFPKTMVRRMIKEHGKFEVFENIKGELILRAGSNDSEKLGFDIENLIRSKFELLKDYRNE